MYDKTGMIYVPYQKLCPDLITGELYQLLQHKEHSISVPNDEGMLEL